MSIRPTAPPFLLQHGTSDPIIPFHHSIELANRLKQALGTDKVTLDLFEDAEHADEWFKTLENVTRVLDFLDKYLKS